MGKVVLRALTEPVQNREGYPNNRELLEESKFPAPHSAVFEPRGQS
jgi:hypothetical protein